MRKPFSTRFLGPVVVAGLLVGLLGVATPGADAKSLYRTRVTSASRDYSVRIFGDAQAVSAGGTAAYPFQLRVGSRFRGAVTFDVVGLPAGVTPSVRSLGGNQFDLELQVGTTVPASSTVATLRARSQGRTRVALLRITVNAAQPTFPQPTLPPPTVPPPPPTPPPPTLPPPTLPAPTVPAPTLPPPPVFEIRTRQAQLNAATDQQVQFFVDVDRSAGYTGNVTFAVSGLPAGATGGFGPNPTIAGTVLYVTPSAATPGGTYTLGISGTAGATIRTTAVILIVAAQTDFSLSANPTSASVAAGANAVYALDVRPLVNSKANVSLDAAGLPGGAKADFGKTPTNAPTSLTISTKSTTPAGTYTITITGRSGPYVHTTTVSLIVANTPGFSLAANPARISAPRGASATTFVTVAPFGGFTGPVTLSTGNLPPFTTPVITTNSQGAFVTFQTSATTPPAVYTVTITGSSTVQSTLVASIPVTLTVT